MRAAARKPLTRVSAAWTLSAVGQTVGDTGVHVITLRHSEVVEEMAARGRGEWKVWAE